MTGKDLFIDFVTTLVALLMFAFVVFFIILGDRFEVVVNFFVNIAPLMFFLLLGVIILNFRRIKIKKIKEEDKQDEIVLFLHYGDRLTSDLVFTGLPVLIILTAFLVKGEVERDDIIQSSLVFAILYLYFKILYKKR